jgi:hypothetical protein
MPTRSVQPRRLGQVGLPPAEQRPPNLDLCACCYHFRPFHHRGSALSSH